MAMAMGHCMATSRTAAAPVLVVVVGAEVLLPAAEDSPGDTVMVPDGEVELPVGFGACVVVDFLVVE